MNKISNKRAFANTINNEKKRFEVIVTSLFFVTSNFGPKHHKNENKTTTTTTKKTATTTKLQKKSPESFPSQTNQVRPLYLPNTSIVYINVQVLNSVFKYCSFTILKNAEMVKTLESVTHVLQDNKFKMSKTASNQKE